MDEHQATASHHSVEKLLFATARVKKDIQTAVEFLTTRVRRPGEDDWRKIRCVLGYIISTIHTPSMLRMDKMNIVKLWVGA